MKYKNCHLGKPLSASELSITARNRVLLRAAQDQAALWPPAMDQPAAAEQHKSKVFISYSRVDGAFAEKLRKALIAHGFEAYLDKKDILPGEPWRDRIEGLILMADAIVFVMSPSSIASEICSWEVGRALELKKSLTPLHWCVVPKDDVPDGLSKYNYVFFDQYERSGMADEAAFEASLTELETALRVTDILWVREHTKWVARAVEWEQSETARPEGKLLRAGDIAAVQRYLALKPATAPDIPPVLVDYLAASIAKEENDLKLERLRLERIRRVQRRFALALAALFVFTVIGAFAVIMQSRVASEKRILALTQRAKEAYDQANFDRAIRYSALAIPGTGTLPWEAPQQAVSEATSLLKRAATRSRLLWNLPAGGKPFVSMKLSPRENRLLTVRDDNGHKLVELWETTSLSRIAHLQIDTSNTESVQTGTSDTESSFAFIQYKGREAIVISGLPTFIWDAQDGKPLQVPEELAPQRLLLFSPDSKYVLVRGLEDKLDILETTQWRRIASLGAPNTYTSTILFSPDSQKVFVGFDDGTAILYEVSTRHALSWKAHKKKITDAIFSPHGNFVLTQSRSTLLGAQGDDTFRAWQTDADKTPKLAFTLGATFSKFQVSSDSRYLFAVKDTFLIDPGSERDEVVIYSIRDGRELARLAGHNDQIVALDVAPTVQKVDSPPGELITLASSAADRTTLLRTIAIVPSAKEKNGENVWFKLSFPLGGHNERVLDLKFVKNSDIMLSLSVDRIRAWRVNRPIEYTIPNYAPLGFPTFTEDGKEMSSYSSDRADRIIDTKTGQIKLTIPHSPNASTDPTVQISADGRWATAEYEDGAVVFWDLQKGAKIATAQTGLNDKPATQFSLSSSSVFYITTDGLISGWHLDSETINRIGPFGKKKATKTILDGDLAFFLDKSGISVWHTTTQQQISVLSIKADDICAIRVIPRTGRVLLCIENGDTRSSSIQLWDINSRKMLKAFQVDHTFFPPIVLSGNNKYAAIGDSSTTVILDLDSLTTKAIVHNKARVQRFADNPSHLLFYQLPVDDFLFHQLVWDLNANLPISDIQAFGFARVSSDERSIIEVSPTGDFSVTDIGNLLASDGDELVSAACKVNLVGAQLFTDVELEDPILAGESNNPCNNRYGPLSVHFYPNILSRKIGFIH